MAKNFLSSDLMKRGMTAPLLDKEEEHRLAVAWRDKQDPEAFDTIIICHVRLVAAMAKQFRNYTSNISDLHQEGMVGLIEAIRRFDPDRDIRFSTYAQWWIRSYMSEYVQKNYSLVRLGSSRSLKALFFNLRRMRAELEKRGREIPEHLPDSAVAIIAESLGAKAEDVRMMEGRLSGRDSSLNMAAGDDGGTDIINLINDQGPGPEEILLHEEKAALRIKLLEEAIETLDERERYIFEKRGQSEYPETLEQVGNHIGISKERVRQIEQKAMKKIRKWISERVETLDDLV